MPILVSERIKKLREEIAAISEANRTHMHRRDAGVAADQERRRTRIGSILPDRQADTLRPFPPFEVVRPFWMTLFPTIHADQISPHPTVHGEHDGAVA